MPEYEYKEYVLAPSVDDYIMEQFDYPRTLARAIMKKRDISKGTKITFQASNISSALLSDYGGGPMDVPKKPIIDWLVNRIQVFLKESDCHIVVLQDPCTEVSHPYVKRLDIPVTAHKEEVYYVIVSEKADDRTYIEKVLRQADWYYFVGIMSSLPKDRLLLSKEFDDQTIDLLVKRTEHLFVRAYDGCGYILCSFGK